MPYIKFKGVKVYFSILKKIQCFVFFWDNSNVLFVIVVVNKIEQRKEI